jgi:hypothetical protein
LPQLKSLFSRTILQLQLLRRPMAILNPIKCSEINLLWLRFKPSFSSTRLQVLLSQRTVATLKPVELSESVFPCRCSNARILNYRSCSRDERMQIYIHLDTLRRFFSSRCSNDHSLEPYLTWSRRTPARAAFRSILHSEIVQMNSVQIIYLRLELSETE